MDVTVKLRRANKLVDQIEGRKWDNVVVDEFGNQTPTKEWEMELNDALVKANDAFLEVQEQGLNPYDYL